jgi:hypothetical protein
MASAVSIAIRVEDALNSIVENIAALSGAYSIAYTPIPRANRDQNLLRAEQLEAVAQFLTYLKREVVDNMPDIEIEEGELDVEDVMMLAEHLAPEKLPALIEALQNIAQAAAAAASSFADDNPATPTIGTLLVGDVAMQSLVDAEESKLPQPAPDDAPDDPSTSDDDTTDAPPAPSGRGRSKSQPKRE